MHLPAEDARGARICLAHRKVDGGGARGPAPAEAAAAAVAVRRGTGERRTSDVVRAHLPLSDVCVKKWPMGLGWAGVSGKARNLHNSLPGKLIFLHIINININGKNPPRLGLWRPAPAL